MKKTPQYHAIVRNGLYLSDGAPTLFYSDPALARRFDLSKKRDQNKADLFIEQHGGRLFPIDGP